MHRDVTDQYYGFWTRELSAAESHPSKFGPARAVKLEVGESPSVEGKTKSLHGGCFCTDSPERAESSRDNEYLLQEQESGTPLFGFSLVPAPPLYLFPHGQEFPPERVASYLDARQRGHRDFINGLPDELLCQIFSFLPGARDRSICASVSMRWLRLQSHMHWEEFQTLYESESETDTSAATSARLQERLSCTQGRGGPIPGMNLGVTGIVSQRRVERQPQWAIGDLSRCLEGKKASDVRLAAIAVGTGARGGLGKLCIRGGSVNVQERGVTDFGLSAIGICCPALKTLSLWDCPFVGDESLIVIGNGCRLLEKLDLLKCPVIGDIGLRAIAQNCSLLSQLSLESCELIGNSSIKAVGNYCMALVSLCICDCPLVSDEGIVKVVSNTKKLRRIKLHRISVGDESLATIAAYCKTLSFLSLENLELISDAGFLHLATTFAVPNLKHMLITNCPGLTDGVLGMLGVSRKGLKHLSLVKCDQVTDEGVKIFLQTVAALEVLQLERCGFISSKGLVAALTSSKTLKELQVKKCDNIDDEGPFYSEFHASTGLKSICLANCRHVGNKCITLIGHACNNVTELDLSGLVTINDDGLLTLFGSGNMKLERLNLSGCIRVTDQVVSVIARTCGSSLQSFFLDGCTLVTDKSLNAIASYCTNLQDLDVSQCGITDQGVTKLLCKRGLGLSTLNLSGCIGITERILPVIARKCKSLVGLNLKHCQGLSREVLDNFASKIWMCDFFCS